MNLVQSVESMVSIIYTCAYILELVTRYLLTPTKWVFGLCKDSKTYITDPINSGFKVSKLFNLFEFVVTLSCRYCWLVSISQ